MQEIFQKNQPDLLIAQMQQSLDNIPKKLEELFSEYITNTNILEIIEDLSYLTLANQEKLSAIESNLAKMIH